MKKHYLILLISLLAFGCAKPRPEMPYYGTWEGLFIPEETGAEELKGFVQLYATGEKFILRMDAGQESYEVTGKWALKEDKIELSPQEFNIKRPHSPDDVELDIDKSERVKNPDLPNNKLFTVEELKEAYGTSFVLNIIQGDPPELHSAPFNLGEIKGRHEFRKGALTQ